MYYHDRLAKAKSREVNTEEKARKLARHQLREKVPSTIDLILVVVMVIVGQLLIQEDLMSSIPDPTYTGWAEGGAGDSTLFEVSLAR
ncbi:hypothetical protein M0R45_027638 [Rubus argutus]|uniref:Uncharacterized protein n=1 Tax=Rubus argutus TaxID=59490 RepID=A0AAW1X2D1_RUBAR